MSATIRRLRPHKSEVERLELQSNNGGLVKVDRPAPNSTQTLGPRIVNPNHGNAVIEIITYGYDADVVNFWSMASQNSVGDHSQKFLTTLANLRDSTDTSMRPLAFVAHSLGGIICQDALLKSRNRADSHTQRILEHTSGILFLGTPHCGSSLAEWAGVGSRFLQYFRRVNHSNLEILRQQSEVMARIRQDFHDMLRGREQSKEMEIAIICFYEELPVRAIGEIVPKASATLDRYTSIGIHANHMDMTKFTSDRDADYQNVLSELRRLTEAVSRPSEEFQLATSESSQIEGELHNETQNQSYSKVKQDEAVARGNASPEPLARPVNIFSGTFYTGGGKMIQGGNFHSRGGSMSF